MEDENQLDEAGAPFLSEEEELAADLKLIAEAEADYAAGRCIPHEEVMAWVETWGSGKRVPPPKSWFR